jgi:hypothetical protein
LIKKVVAFGATLACLSLFLATPSGAEAQRCPSSPPVGSAGWYDYVQTYNGACSTRHNYDRQFDDVTLTRLVDGRNTLSVTASTALAGAIASIRVNGKEFIGSGGYGSALQYAFHAWQQGGSPSECYNPTQAGARIDSDEQVAPFHKRSSTSALYTLAARDRSTMHSAQRPAMFMTRGDTHPGFDGCIAADHQPDAQPYKMGLSPYWLETEVRMWPALENVIQMTAKLTSDDARHDHFHGVLVAYVQRDFTDVFSYDAATHRLVPQPPAHHASRDPLVRCTADGSYCLGIYVRPEVLGNDAYYYAMSREPTPYNAMLGDYTVQVSYPTTDVARGDRLFYEQFLVVGDRDRVAGTLRALGSTVGQS